MATHERPELLPARADVVSRLLLLFAIGPVSGTTLSFELSLLRPAFKKDAGAVIGVPFSAEGFALFIEAIFAGIYLYGWDRLSPVTHWLRSFAIALSGALSAAFVTSVNAWMNTPAGFAVEHGHAVDTGRSRRSSTKRCRPK